MNPIQNRIIELLVEIDTLCSELKISYTLGDHLLWSALTQGQFTDESYDAVVYIDELSFVSVCKSLGENDNREVFKQGHPLVYYMASDSLLFDMDIDDINNPCGIKITLGTMKYDKAGHELLLRGPGGVQYISLDNSANLTKDMTFENHSFSALLKGEDFLKALLGVTWMNEDEYPAKSNSIRFGVISDPKLPYRIWVDSVKNNNLCTNEDLRYRRDFNHWMKYSFNPMKRVIDGNRLLLKRAGDRYMLFEYYVPIKKELLTRWNDGQYDLVESVMQPYLSLLHYYQKKDTTIYFDKDLFSIAEQILISKDTPWAYNLKSLIPSGIDGEEISINLEVTKNEMHAEERPAPQKWV